VVVWANPSLALAGGHIVKRILLVILVLAILPLAIASDTPAYVLDLPERTPTSTPIPAVPGWMIYNTRMWKSLVDRWHDEFPNVPKALVYSIIAKESQGFPYLVSEDGHGSVGLMQIIPRSWTNTERKLKNPNINIYVGTWMLSNILERSNGDMRYTLAVYNCGDKGVKENKCGTRGGYVYADDVLETYYPIFRKLVIEDRTYDLLIIEKMKCMYR
jgi:soluble lytic murein transglycosylase-like protein